MIVLGTDEQFASLREFLAREYTPAQLARDLKIESMDQLMQRVVDNTMQDVLFRVLFGGATTNRARMLDRVGQEVFNNLKALGLVEEDGNSCHSPVMLYPFGAGTWIVSDRFTAMTGELLRDADREFVYLALTQNTLLFARSTPTSPCESLLEIGTGSGAVALNLANTAQEVWATDVSERCTFFTEFNRRLNGLTNVKVGTGSLYEPVAGRSFDRVLCHPPYDTSFNSRWTYSDGGVDGEFVINGVIAGLPDHLRAGGRFWGLARVADREGEPAEVRIRNWLGSQNHEFDVLLIVRDVVMPQEYAFASIYNKVLQFENFDAQMKRFKELRVETLPYCHIVIERRADADAPPLTLRRMVGKKCTEPEIDFLLTTQRMRGGLDLENIRPEFSDTCRLRVIHEKRNGPLLPVEYWLEVSAPFAETFTCPEWVARMAVACDGKHTGLEIMTHIQKKDPVKRHEFEAALQRLIVAGAVTAATAEAAQAG